MGWASKVQVRVRSQTELEAVRMALGWVMEMSTAWGCIQVALPWGWSMASLVLRKEMERLQKTSDLSIQSQVPAKEDNTTQATFQLNS